MSMHSAPKSRAKKGMGKDDFRKMQPQLQTVLRVNMQCQCEGCRSKIRSVLKKIKGVESCKIDLEQGKVTVIGEVDPGKLMEKLSQKTDKHVELWGFPKAMNMNNLNNNQMKNIHVAAETGKGGKGPQKQGGGGGGGQEMMNLHQMFPKAALNGKGGMVGADFKIPPQFKDMKMMMPPSKDQKSVKFQLPDNDSEDEDVTDDEFGYDDEDDESFEDESDDDHDGHDDHNHAGGAKKAGGGKKGFSLSNVPLLKRLGSKKEEKSENEGGNKKGGKKGDESHNPKHGGGKNNGKKDGNSFEQVKPDAKNGGKGNGGGGKNMKGGHKEAGGQTIDVGKLGPGFPQNMGQMGRNMGNGQGQVPAHHGQGQVPGHHGQGQAPGHHGQGQAPGHHGQGQGQMGFGANYPLGGQMGNFQATQGLPGGGGGVQYPPGMGQGNNNPYSNQQQQYMAMMMNQRQQQQQQQAYGNGMNNIMQQQQQPYGNGMMYGRPPPPMNYGPPPTPPHAMDNHFTHYFNDENTNSCSIM